MVTHSQHMKHSVPHSQHFKYTMTHSSVTHGDTFKTHEAHCDTFTVFELESDTPATSETHLGTCIIHVNILTRSQYLQYITTPEAHMTQTQHLRHIPIHNIGNTFKTPEKHYPIFTSESYVHSIRRTNTPNNITPMNTVY